MPFIELSKLLGSLRKLSVTMSWLTTAGFSINIFYVRCLSQSWWCLSSYSSMINVQDSALIISLLPAVKNHQNIHSLDQINPIFSMTIFWQCQSIILEQVSSLGWKAMLKVRGSELFLQPVFLINKITKDYKELLLKTQATVKYWLRWTIILKTSLFYFNSFQNWVRRDSLDQNYHR